jgi:hypothetical protein
MERGAKLMIEKAVGLAGPSAYYLISMSPARGG